MIKKYPQLAELHSHLGAAVQPHIMWSLAHEQGIKLPTKNYWAFAERLRIKQGEYASFWEINQEVFKLAELIQSSPIAVEPAVHHTLSGAYRNSNIVLHELRFCPAKRNRGGERDLDYIILAAVRGLEKALLEFPEIKAGIIVCLDREFDYAVNKVMYEKALKYKQRGIIGIDLAGPQRDGFKAAELVDIFQDAKANGLGTTVHSGEEGDLAEMRFCVDKIRPDRIGHGFLAAKFNDREILGRLAADNIYLELCPSSNLIIGHIQNFKEMRLLYRRLYAAGVKLTINSDDPEFLNTNVQKELKLLLDKGIFSQAEISQLIKNSFTATFLK